MILDSAESGGAHLTIMCCAAMLGSMSNPGMKAQTTQLLGNMLKANGHHLPPRTPKAVVFFPSVHPGQGLSWLLWRLPFRTPPSRRVFCQHPRVRLVER